MEILVFSVIGFAAFFIKGMTGAASAIVFNGLFLAALSLDGVHGLTLLDGLVWLALADATTSVMLASLIHGELRFDRFARLQLSGFLPVSIGFTVALSAVPPQALATLLALLVLGAGGWMLLARPATLTEAAAERLALPVGAARGSLGVSLVWPDL